MANLVHAIHRSNLSHQEKSGFRRWLDDVRAGGSNMIHGGGAKSKTEIASDAAKTFRQAVEGGVTSIGLAALHVEKGLDIKKVPLDLMGGVAIAALGTFVPHEEAGTTLRNVGTTGIHTYLFRKAFGILSARKQKAGGKVAGTFAGEGDAGDDVGEDPILRAVAGLR
jgi:hypothetical protein